MNLVEDLRPRRVADIVGNVGVVETFMYYSQDISNRSPKAVMLVGPTGSGKTSLARIHTAMLVDHDPIHEPDGTYSPNPQSSGPSKALRGVPQGEEYLAFDGASFGRAESQRIEEGPCGIFNRTKVVFIDEVQELSASSLAALRGKIERNTKLFWIFCASDLKKIDRSIWTRTLLFELKPPDDMEIAAYLFRLTSSDRVLTQDGEHFPSVFEEEGIPTIVSMSNGSVREAVQLLQRCHDSRLYSRADIERELS